jgi:hypothetical protein
MRGLKTFALSLLILIATSTAALASGARHVHVNGQHLNAQQIASLDSIAGSFVPDGFYWLNLSTGVWGYEGNPTPAGRIGGGNVYVGPDGAPGYNRNTAGGSIMSDGRCSFVLGVPVGDCD